MLCGFWSKHDHNYEVCTPFFYMLIVRVPLPLDVRQTLKVLLGSNITTNPLSFLKRKEATARPWSNFFHMAHLQAAFLYKLYYTVFTSIRQSRISTYTHNIKL